MPSRPQAVVPICITCVLIACGGGDATQPKAPVASVTLTPTNATVVAGATQALEAHALDAHGAVLSDRAITFSTSTAATATVNPSGVVSGLTVGTATITATSESQSAHTEITVTPGAAAVLEKLSGDGQTAAAAQPLPAAIVLRLTDALTNPVSGVAITFAIRSGGGSVGSATVISDATGRASTTWTLGTIAGADTVVATSTGVTPVLFSATTTPGPAAALVTVSGDQQLGVVNTALAAPLVARVVDQFGNGVSGTAVVWSIATGTGTLSASRVVTDVTGLASVQLTMGPRAGTRTVAATVAPFVPVGFSSIASAPGVRDDWPTYGHDAARSGASQASVPGVLRIAWRYDPADDMASVFNHTNHALARADAVMLEWGGQSTFLPQFIAGPAVDRISPSGQRVWSWHAGNDADLGTWGSIWSSPVGDLFAYNNDGYGYLDLATGASLLPVNCDSWGETAVEGAALYLVNDDRADCVGIHVASLDATGHARWFQDPSRGQSRYAQVSSFVLSSGVLIYSADYQSPTGSVGSGLFALDPQTGALLRSIATIPQSHLSADATRLYQGEYDGTFQLVARAQSDLHVVWSTPVAAVGQAPVLANDLVIISTGRAIAAFRAETGALVWTAPLGTATMAAALGSGTLVVTDEGGGIRVLSLADGRELSHLTMPGFASQLHDPIIVNDPVHGAVVYAVDSRGVIAFAPVASSLRAQRFGVPSTSRSAFDLFSLRLAPPPARRHGPEEFNRGGPPITPRSP